MGYRYGESRINPGTAAYLLDTILRTPSAGPYIENLSIHGWAGGFNHAQEVSGMAIHAPYSKERMELFTKALRASEIVPPDELEHWIAEIERGDEDPVLAMILERLPNLKTLVFVSEGKSSGDRLFWAIQRLVQDRKFAALSRLSKVNLGKESSADFFGLRWLHLFSSVPSVREIGGYRIDRRIDEDEYCDDPSLFGSSNVTVLELKECGIRSSWLSESLQSFKTLESFSYIDCHYYDPGPEQVLQGLLKCPESRLKSLHISGEAFDESIQSSLAGLHALEHLEIERRCLVADGSSMDASSLKGMLPLTLQTLRFIRSTNRHVSDLTAIIEYVTDAILFSLPELKIIIFEIPKYVIGRVEGDDALVEVLKSRCNELGMQLVVNEEFTDA